ncbi:MAG: hypothetical protein M1825_003238 [Sarcosagium campestre]|nr:MAG: hypothetical protein M1825_003238 [Sarcosagium campestre]
MARSLAEEINSATRTVHTRLNRLITARLPLALPPSAQSPLLYLTGLQHIAPIYETFETRWSRAVAVDSSLSPWSLSHRHRAILKTLYLPSLLRSQSITADLAHPAALHQPITPPLHTSSPHLHGFILHIERALAASPSLMLAYTWVFYMALFSGGRWIRAQLSEAGPAFWGSLLVDYDDEIATETGSSAAGLENEPPLRIFNFPGDEDGEDIKREFKARFADVEQLITPAERTAIVEEAGKIFELLIALIGDIDANVSSILKLDANDANDGNVAVMLSGGGGDDGSGFVQKSEQISSKQTSSATMMTTGWQAKITSSPTSTVIKKWGVPLIALWVFLIMSFGLQRDFRLRY